MVKTVHIVTPAVLLWLYQLAPALFCFLLCYGTVNMLSVARWHAPKDGYGSWILPKITCTHVHTCLCEQKPTHGLKTKPPPPHTRSHTVTHTQFIRTTSDNNLSNCDGLVTVGEFTLYTNCLFRQRKCLRVLCVVVLIRCLFRQYWEEGFEIFFPVVYEIFR